MKKIEFRTDKDILYISLEGRIDATNSADVEKEINDKLDSLADVMTVESKIRLL